MLEIAWSRRAAVVSEPADESDIHSYLVEQPPDRPVPRRIATLTGIDDDLLAAARPPAVIWRKLLATADSMRPAASGRAPAVAHFARFERTFLRHLHEHHGAGGPFPLELICTHEIACRLLPDLPRRGLRAIAGYLGHVTPESRRAASHVAATASVWSGLTRLLAQQHGVDTLESLYDWLRSTPAAVRGGRAFALDREHRLALPDAPGVYRMQALGGEVLYVGKATSLKSRVNSYFQKRSTGNDRLAELLTQVRHVDTTIVATPLEAALLESDEIKHLEPPYNVALRSAGHSIVHVSADLSAAQPARDAEHPRGPFPRPEPLLALGALVRLLRDRESASSSTYRAVLGLGETAAPDRDCLGDGVVLLARHHGLPKAPSVTRMLQLGSTLWARRQEQLEARRRPAEDEDEPAELELIAERAEYGWRRDQDGEWMPNTAEGSAAAFESIVLRASHWVRRAHWLRQLSESQLRFQSRSRNTGDADRLLVFRSGNLQEALDVAPDTPPPELAAREHDRADRLATADLATHDRLRVLSTEIRILVTAGRRMQLTLSSGRSLDRPTLARWLYWI